jgi:hypothetical protein
MLAQTARLLRDSAQLMEASSQGQTPNLSFTVDMGYIPPLYYLALKCRVPRLRRRAIELIISTPHKEGIWDGEVAAYVARQVMETEEESLIGVETNAVPLDPCKNRINQVTVLLPNGVGEAATLVCERWKVRAGEVVRESWTKGFNIDSYKASLGGCIA